MDTGYQKLIELRSCIKQYSERASHYADTLEQKERWMLHFDVLTLLIDDEVRTDEGFKGKPRFICLETLERSNALSLCNVHRSAAGLSMLQSLPDAIDLQTHDMVELKVTYIPDVGSTEYIAKSLEASNEIGSILVIADTNSCSVIQPFGAIFSRNLAAVQECLIKRKTVMAKYGLSDLNITAKLKIGPLPDFLSKQFKRLNVTDTSWTFNPADGKGHKSSERAAAKIAKMETSKGWLKERISQQKNLKRKIDDEIREIGGPDFKKSKITLSVANQIEGQEIAAREASNLPSTSRTKTAQLMERRKDVENSLQFHRSKLVVTEREIEQISRKYVRKDLPIVIPQLPKEPFMSVCSKDLLMKYLNGGDESFDPCPWRCPILPPHLCKFFFVEDVSPADMLRSMEFEEPFIKSKDWENDWRGFQNLILETQRNPFNIMELNQNPLSSVMKDPEKLSVLDLFGVGWKKTKEAPEYYNVTDYDFPQQKDAPKVGYPYAFEAYSDAMTEELSVISLPSLAYSERPSAHVIDHIAEIYCNSIYSKLSKKNVMVFISMVENYFNKQGGMLSTGDDVYAKEKKKGAKQSRNLRILFNPLETVVYTDETSSEESKKRMFCGFNWRGPSHARHPTDTTNNFMVYFLKTTLNHDFHPQISQGEVKIGNDTFFYGIRRYGNKRLRPTFFSFLSNALFEPMNSAGEKFFRRTNMAGTLSEEAALEDARNSYDDIERAIIESVLVGVNMNNFDEGLMPFIRYEFLDAMSKLNNEESYCIKPNKYIAKFTEELERAGWSKVYLHKVFSSYDFIDLPE